MISYYCNKGCCLKDFKNFPNLSILGRRKAKFFITMRNVLLAKIKPNYEKIRKVKLSVMQFFLQELKEQE